MSMKTVRELQQPEIEYRDIPGFPGYRIGSDGSVWSIWMRNGRLSACGELRRMKSRISRCYHSIGLLDRERRRQKFPVHILVLTVFVGPRPEGMWGLHRDDDKTNNHLSNLYWGTPKQNAADRYRNGHDNTVRGSAKVESVLTEAKVEEMRLRRSAGETYEELGRQFQVTAGAARQACTGSTWKHVQTPTCPPVLILPSSTRCKHGHPLEGYNLRVSPEGHRVCRTCVREQARRSRENRRVKGEANGNG